MRPDDASDPRIRLLFYVIPTAALAAVWAGLFTYELATGAGAFDVLHQVLAVVSFVGILLAVASFYTRFRIVAAVDHRAAEQLAAIETLRADVDQLAETVRQLRDGMTTVAIPRQPASYGRAHVGERGIDPEAIEAARRASSRILRE